MITKELFVAICFVLLIAVLYQGVYPNFRRRRENRTSKEVSLALERIRQIARLTTAIDLQQGLVSGKIQSDELIAELLFFGQLTPSKMASMNVSRLQEAFKNIKELPTSLAGMKEVQEIETKLERIEALRKSVEAAGGGPTWNGKDEFLKEMATIEKNGLDLGIIAETKNNIDDWVSEMRKIKKSPDPADHPTLIKTLKRYTENILNVRNTFKQSKMKHSIIEVSTLLSPLFALVNAVNFTSESISTIVSFTADDNHFTASKNNVKMLSSFSRFLGEVRPDVEAIRRLLETRKSKDPSGQFMNYPGFTYGFEDMEGVSYDQNDEWMQARAQVPGSFPLLRALSADFKKVDEVFKDFGNNEIGMLSRLLEQVDGILTVSADASSVTEAMDDLWKSKTLLKNVQVQDTTEVNNFIRAAKGMDDSLGGLEEKMNDFIDVWNNDEVIGLLNEVKKILVAGDAAQTIDALQTSTKVDQLSVLLNTATARFSHVQSISEGAKITAKQLLNTTNVDAYIQKLTSFQPLFKHLNDFGKTRADLVAAGIGMSRKFRDGKGATDAVSDGEKVTMGVLEAASKFGPLKESISKTKGSGGAESDALRALPEARKHSMTLGLGSRGLTAMRSLLNYKSSADVVIEYSGVVESQLTIASLDPTQKNSLKALVELKSSLEAIFKELDVWKDVPIDESPTSLESLSAVFIAAARVPWSAADLNSMSTAVNELLPKVTNKTVESQLAEVKKSLDTLQRIGLDFSSYRSSFSSSGASLAALDSFFDSIPNKSPIKDKSLSSSTLWIIGFCCLGFLSVLFLILFFGFKRTEWNWKKFRAKCIHKPKVSPAPTDKPATVPTDKTTTAPPATKVPPKKVPNKNEGKVKTNQGNAPIRDYEKEEDVTQIVREEPVELTGSAVRAIAKKVNELWNVAYVNLVNRIGVNPEQETLRVLQELCIINFAKVPVVSVTNSYDELSNTKYDECRPPYPLYINSVLVIHKIADFLPLKGYGKMFENDFYNINKAILRDGMEFLVGQLPYKKGKIDNRAKLWWLARYHEIEFMVQIVTKEEIQNPDLGLDSFYLRETNKPLAINDNLSIVCTEIATVFSGAFQTNVTIQFKGFEPHDVIILHINDWAQDCAPEDSSQVELVLGEVRTSLQPVMVLSPTGRGRAGTFMAIEMFAQHWYFKGEVNIPVTLLEARKKRAGSVAREIHLGFVLDRLLNFVQNDQDIVTAVRGGLSLWVTSQLNVNKKNQKFMEAWAKEAARQKELGSKGGRARSEGGREEREENEIVCTPGWCKWRAPEPICICFFINQK